KGNRQGSPFCEWTLRIDKAHRDLDSGDCRFPGEGWMENAPSCRCARDHCEIQSLGRVQSPLVPRRRSYPGWRSGDPRLRTETGAVTAEAVVREEHPTRARLPKSRGIGDGGCDLVF